ncbi:MAG TPA: AI-2E family transporter [Candidatus Saccharimonadales bacterium]|nr:AI-2E family transporter [Candidatus Saccharimonadales bacterium]
MTYRPGPKLRAGIFFAATAIVAIAVAWLMKPVIVPLLLSSVLYVLVEPLVSLLQRKGMARVTAILLTLGGLTVLAVLVAAWAAEPLGRQLGLLRERLPGAWEDVSAAILDLERRVTEGLGMEMRGSKILDRIHVAIGAWSGGAVGAVYAWIATLALWFVTIPIVAFFLLRDYRSLRNAVIGLTPNRHFEMVLAIYHRVAHQLQAYFRGVMIQSGIMAVITTAGFFLIGLPMAPVLGILAGVLNIIPYLGPVLGLVAPSVVALTTGSGADVYAGVLAVVLLAQLVDNFLVIPAVVARAANIHPLVALLGVIIAGSLFHLAGMVFAIPVLSSSRIVYRGILSGLERRPLNPA